MDRKAALRTVGFLVAGAALFAQSTSPVPIRKKKTKYKEPAIMTVVPPKQIKNLEYGEIMRIPYLEYRVYPMQVVPDADVVLELPPGEGFKYAWVDKKYFAAEGPEGEARVFIHALQVPYITGKKRNLHIVTQNDLRITFELEAVSPDTPVPAVWQMYIDKTDDASAKLIELNRKAKLQGEVIAAKKELQLRSNYEGWKATTMASLYDNFKWTGDWPINRVVTNGVQTWVYLSSKVNQAGTISLINKENKTETVDFEYLNGVYVINHVLTDKEKFQLELGKDVSKIRRG